MICRHGVCVFHASTLQMSPSVTFLKLRLRPAQRKLRIRVVELCRGIILQRQNETSIENHIFQRGAVFDFAAAKRCCTGTEQGCVTHRPPARPNNLYKKQWPSTQGMSGNSAALKLIWEEDDSGTDGRLQRSLLDGAVAKSLHSIDSAFCWIQHVECCFLASAPPLNF